MTSGEVLAKIGPAAINAVAPLVPPVYYDPEWNRLAAIRIQGGGMSAELASAVTAASMSFSSDQIGQLSITFDDTADASILRSRIIGRKTAIDYGRQHMEVQSIDVGPGDGGPTITIKGRARSIAALTRKPHVGKGSWGEHDVSAWVTDRCREGGAMPRVQPGFGKLLFTRTSDDDTTWAMMQRAADAVGAWCFEVENYITFARPTWLFNRGRTTFYDIRWLAQDNYSPGITGLPAYSWSSGSGEGLSLELISDDAHLARPGHAVVYSGNVGDAGGNWIVTGVNQPLTNTSPVGLTCVRPTDPPKQSLGV